MLYNNAGGATPRDDYILKMPLDEFDHAIGPICWAPAGLPSCDSLYESTWRRLDHQHPIHPSMIGTPGADACTAAKGRHSHPCPGPAVVPRASGECHTPGAVLTERVKKLMEQDNDSGPQD